MSVAVKEILKIKDGEGVEHVGEALAGNLIAIKDGEKVFYGTPVERVKLLTKIVCDAGKDCVNLTALDDFTTQPKTIEFEETGGNEEFLKDIANVTILQDYKGDRIVFCSKECALGFLKRLGRQEQKVADISGGKGYRSSDRNVVEAQATLENPESGNPEGIL